MKPNVIFPGVQKAATTTLFNILSKHPDIFIPYTKEINFFSFESEYINGLDYYLKNYDNSNELIRIDMSTSYIYYDKAIERIKMELGNEVKFVVMLRDPVSRAFSQYLMSQRRGYEKLSFLEAIEIEKDRITQSEFNFNHLSYINRSKYYSQLSRLYSYYPKDNILVVFVDDLEEKPQETVNSILEFIGARTDVELEYNTRSNISYSPKSLKLNILINNPKLRKMISTIVKNKVVLSFFRRKIVEKNKATKTEISIKREERRIAFGYLEEEIIQLENLLGILPASWYKF